MLKLMTKKLPLILILMQLVIASLIFRELCLYLLSLDGIVVRDKILGGDYIAFYSAGNLYNQTLQNLYDFGVQRDNMYGLFPQLSNLKYGELPFVYPPIVAFIFSKLALFSYLNSYLIFLTLGITLSVISLYLLNDDGRKSKFFLGLFFLQLLSFTPYIVDTFLGGQVSWVGIIIYSLVVRLLIDSRYFYAGALFSLSYYKPPLFLLSLICFSLIFGLRFVYGFLIGALLILSFSFFFMGFDLHQEYFKTVLNYTYGRSLYEGFKLPLSEGMGVYSLLAQLQGNYLISICILILFCICISLFSLKNKAKILENKDALKIWLSLIIASSLAFSVQLIKYDLAILLVPFVIMSNLLMKINLKAQALFLISVLCFYLEFCFRKIDVFGYVLNLSIFVFIFFLIVLFIILKDSFNHLEKS